MFACGIIPCNVLAALQHSFCLFPTYFAKIKLLCANISEVLSVHDLWAQHQKPGLETRTCRACSQFSLQNVSREARRKEGEFGGPDVVGGETGCEGVG